MRGKANHVKLLLCVLFLPLPARAQYGGGTGEPNDPYLIYTAEQMNTIGAEPNDWDKHFKLSADIDLIAYSGTDFNIIGSGGLPSFRGVFDGSGHTISNFTRASTEMRSAGIFGYIDDPNACISNLGLIDPNLDASSAVAAGSLVGWLDQGTIVNCYVLGGNVSGKSNVGGLVGTNGGRIKDCYATGNVVGVHGVGGLVGRNRKTIEECHSAGTVIGDGAVGGLVGTNNYGRVLDCSSVSSTTGRDTIGGLVGGNSGLVANGYSDSDIGGTDYVGGLVGRNDGMIVVCASRSRVNGAKEVGGLVGHNSFDGEIQNSYAIGDVIGQQVVGGLVGTNVSAIGTHGGVVFRRDKIRRCYSTAVVSGGQETGGLVGHDDENGAVGCFWDIDTSGQSISGGGLGKTTAEMQTAATFREVGWDFVGEAENGVDDIWAAPPEGGYPVLWWQLTPLPELPVFSGGAGTSDDPYQISTADELNSIGSNPRLMMGHFELIGDIDLAGVEFFTIACQWCPFSGMFDGNGHTISNFNYDSGGRDNVGLFGQVGHPNARIRDLRLLMPTVDGADNVGSLVGHLDAGAIVSCSVERGYVNGEDNVGGLVGQSDTTGIITRCRSNCATDGQDAVGGLVGNNDGIITASYSTAGVTGQNAVGGLVGRNSPGEILNCYAAGEVMGRWYVGGLVGTNAGGSGGFILNCYSTAVVLGGHQSGGLVGANPPGDVHNSFWDIEASGIVSWGGTGKTTAEMQTAGTFLDAGWDFVDETGNGTEDIWCICDEPGYPTLAWEDIAQ
ncbi:MAG: GLUG motif-containing protein [Planctomycetota bacterium]|jgi:hypothetical protein